MSQWRGSSSGYILQPLASTKSHSEDPTQSSPGLCPPEWKGPSLLRGLCQSCHSQQKTSPVIQRQHPEKCMGWECGEDEGPHSRTLLGRSQGMTFWEMLTSQNLSTMSLLGCRTLLSGCLLHLEERPCRFRSLQCCLSPDHQSAVVRSLSPWPWQPAHLVWWIKLAEEKLQDPQPPEPKGDMEPWEAPWPYTSPSLAQYLMSSHMWHLSCGPLHRKP